MARKRITISILASGEQFHDADGSWAPTYETVWILRELANKIEELGLPGEHAPVLDSSGKIIGGIKVRR